LTNGGDITRRGQSDRGDFSTGGDLGPVPKKKLKGVEHRKLESLGEGEKNTLRNLIETRNNVPT